MKNYGELLQVCGVVVADWGNGGVQDAYALTHILIIGKLRSQHQRKSSLGGQHGLGTILMCW